MTNRFGETLKDQIEERLKFLATGAKPRKNKDAMAEVMEELKSEGLYYNGKTKTADENGTTKTLKNDKKKSKVVESSSESESESSEDEKPKKKRDKKE